MHIWHSIYLCSEIPLLYVQIMCFQPDCDLPGGEVCILGS